MNDLEKDRAYRSWAKSLKEVSFCDAGLWIDGYWRKGGKIMFFAVSSAHISWYAQANCKECLQYSECGYKLLFVSFHAWQ